PCCPRHDEKRPSGVGVTPKAPTVDLDESTRAIFGLRRLMDVSACLARLLSPWQRNVEILLQSFGCRVGDGDPSYWRRGVYLFHLRWRDNRQRFAWLFKR